MEGEAITSIRHVPSALLRTLYRPLLNEVVNLQTRLAAFEGTVLLVVTMIRLPAMARDFRRWRQYPYFIFSIVAVTGFVVGFSAIFNLGILARQRTQVLPLLLVLLVGLGRSGEPDPDPSRGAESGRVMVTT